MIRRRPADAGTSFPGVVFVHGAMDRAASFSRVMRRLPDLDVMAIDRRGYAGSVGSGIDERLAGHADDLRRVVEWSGLDRVLVVGHSLGGTIALIAEIAGMPTVDSLAIFEAPMPWLPDYGGQGGLEAVKVGRADGPAAAAEHFMRNMIGEGGWNRLREVDRAARRAEGSALMAELVDVRRPEIEPDLTAIHVPVTVGLGSRSRPHLQAAARVLADQIPGALLVELTEAPHGAHLARPDDFASWVRTARSRVRDA